MLIAHDSSVDIGNHRYTNEQNCILLKKKVRFKKILRGFVAQTFFAPPPPQSKNRSYGLGYDVHRHRELPVMLYLANSE